MRNADNSVKRARKLRREMSLPEVLLWQALRKRPSNLKFRRQHPAGPYVLDFFCGDASLAIEIDGTSHDFGDRPARDAEKDAWLKSQGIRTLRIPATEILKNLDGAVTMIVAQTEG